VVAFNDRRRSPRASFDEVLPRLPLQKGETVGKSLIGGRYLVRGVPVENEEGAKTRQYVLHEVLPSGDVIERGEPFESRAKAKRETRQMKPTRVIEI
jgi:DNA gyrase inhibitor GyrI